MNWHKKVYGYEEEYPFPENWNSIRREVLKRDGYRCILCDTWGSPYNLLTAHHIVSRAKGGSHDIDNLATLCVECHNEIELEDFDNLDQFWHYVVRWRRIADRVRAREEGKTKITTSDDWHKWVYGVYRNPNN